MGHFRTLQHYDRPPEYQSAHRDQIDIVEHPGSDNEDKDNLKDRESIGDCPQKKAERDR